MSDSFTVEQVTMEGRAEARAVAAKAGAVQDGRFWQHPLPEEPAEGQRQEYPPVHEKAVPWAEVLWGAWRPMRRRDREHDALYENRELRMLAGKSMKWLESVGFDTSSLFVTTGIVDTFHARMIRRKTMPMFVVDDAEWSLKSRAQNFRRWLHGKLREAKFEEVYNEVVNDMFVRGDGLVYCDDGDDDVFMERVHRSEMLIDPYEAKQGPQAVRTIYRYRTVSKDSLIEKFPEYTAEIMACPEATIDRVEEIGSDPLVNEREIGTRDVVVLVEAWHPPAREPKPGKDGGGRMFVGLANVTLCYREWRSVDFPFARLACFKPKRGFWSVGVVERLRKIQMSINRAMSNIDMNAEIVGRGMWVVPEQFDVPGSLLSHGRPFKMTYKGPKPPEFMHPVPFSPQQLQLLQFKIDQAHNLVGSAQWSAQGRSPLGAGASGVAIDTMEDLLSDRHASPEENCGIFRVAVAQCLLDAGARVAERAEEEEYEYEDWDEDDKPTKKKGKRKAPFEATWLDKGVLERLDWHAVALTRKQYRLQLEPVGFMPSTRAGKLAATNELIKVGAIQQDQAANLYDEPDIAHLNRLMLASKHNNERMCEQVGMLDKPMPQPSEYHDLVGLLAMCRQYYNRAENEMDPVKHRAERQRVLLRYMDFGDAIMAQQDVMARAQAEKDAQMRRDAEAGMAPPPGAPPGGPMDAGMPPGDPGMGAPPPGPMPPMMPPGAPMPPMA